MKSELEHHIEVLAAIKSKDAKALNLLKGVTDINYRDQNDGSTYLHHAVEAGNLEVVKHLLDHDAKNVKNKAEQTPLALANKLNHRYEIQRILQEKFTLLKRSAAHKNALNVENYAGFPFKRKIMSYAPSGYKYEYVMLAHLVLLLREDKTINQEDWFITSNVEKISAFDDIVLKLTKNGKTDWYFLQLKHTEKIEQKRIKYSSITNDSVENPKDNHFNMNFMFSKWIENREWMEEQSYDFQKESQHYILFSPMLLSPDGFNEQWFIREDVKDHLFATKNTECLKLRPDPEIIGNLVKNVNGAIFAGIAHLYPDLPNSEKAARLFVQQLHFFLGQANVKELEQMVKNKICSKIPEVDEKCEFLVKSFIDRCENFWADGNDKFLHEKNTCFLEEAKTKLNKLIDEAQATRSEQV